MPLQVKTLTAAHQGNDCKLVEEKQPKTSVASLYPFTIATRQQLQFYVVSCKGENKMHLHDPKWKQPEH